MSLVRILAVTTMVSALARPVWADQVINDDLIAKGSVCTGMDCVQGQSFGFDTTILKENNLRILFDDTSSSGSFPSTDWRVIVNDSSNGGLAHFSIENVQAGVHPVTIFDGAPHQALVIDKGGVGFGIDPQHSLHVGSGDTPVIRIEQTGELGWAPQVWDLGGNESNFFFRDSTSGALPIRILPGTQDNSLVVVPNGRVGMGTEVPAGMLHIASGQDFPIGGAEAQLVVENQGSADGVLLRLSGQGSVNVVFEDTSSGVVWEQRVGPDPQVAGGRAWVLREAGAAEAMAVTHDGQLRLAGAVAQGSSRRSKHGIEPVTASDVLQRLVQLPLSRWRYRRDQAQAEHLGPMAEDFHQQFGLGADDRHVSPGDLAGVAMASAQALHRVVEGQAVQLSRLQQQLADTAGQEAELIRLRRRVDRAAQQETELRALRSQVGELEARLAQLERLVVAR